MNINTSDFKLWEKKQKYEKRQQQIETVMPAPAYFTPVSEKNNENCENHKANNNV